MASKSLSSLFLLLFSASLLAESAPSQTKETPAEECGPGPRSMRAGLRHIENKGIGYNTGYSTLETFLAAPPGLWSVMPFLDLRGHIFNSGKWAANGGVGLRSLMGDRVYGVYTYYDYRNTKHKNYNQISFGLETLGTLWDLRLNGYVPFGNTKSHGYDLAFDQFVGNNAFITRKFEYALAGANGEAGVYLLKKKDFDLYAATGPYYLKGKLGTGLWGGEARIKATYKSYIGLEGNYSYDKVFKNIVQGQISFNIPFGPKSHVKKSSRRSCTDSEFLYQRMVQPVVKNEIIPVRHKKEESIAINPATGAPYVFLFVDNTSHSAGTYESPYPTLVAAQNISQPGDIIYVFPGDLTTRGLDAGITLKDNQKLWGSVVSHTLNTSLGAVTILSTDPSQTFTDDVPAITLALSPVITNLSTGDVVTLANNNEVSGLYIQNLAGNGIAASSVNDLTVTNCFIQGPNYTTVVMPPAHYGINLSNVSGTVLIDSNLIYQGITGVNIAATGIQNATYTVSNNDAPAGAFITSASYGNFLVTTYTDCANLTTNITGNSFTAAQAAVIMTFDNTIAGLQACPVVINNNQMNADGDYAPGIASFALNHYANVDLILTNNDINTPYTNAITITQNDISALDNHSQLNVLIESNTCDSWVTNLSMSLQGTAQLTGSIANNDFFFDDASGILITAIEASTIPNLSITGNQISGDLVSYTSSDAISITLGTLSGTGTSTAAISISSNNIQAGSHGITLVTSADTEMTASVTNNTLTHAQYSGLNFQTNDSSTGTWTVNQNTILASGLGYQNPPIGAAFITATGSSTTNLSFNDNLAAPIYPDPTLTQGTYIFTNTGSTFNITSYEGNTGVRNGP